MKMEDPDALEVASVLARLMRSLPDGHPDLSGVQRAWALALQMLDILPPDDDDYRFVEGE